MRGVRALLLLIPLAFAVVAQEPEPAPGHGRKTYREMACWQCHTQAQDKDFPPITEARRAGPVIDATEQPRSREWHLAHFYAPRTTSPGSVMPAYLRHFSAHERSLDVRAFLERYDGRDGSMDQEGIVTRRDYERAGGTRWEQDLARLDTGGNGIVSMADAAPQPDAALAALVDYVVQLDRAPVPEHFPAVRKAPRDKPRSIERGGKLFAEYCTGCHGERGNGNGPAARFFGDYPPRNFLRGEFRYGSTAVPDPPTDEDIFRSIRRGAGPSMPSWPLFTDVQVWDLVEFVKSHHPGYLPHELFVSRKGRVKAAFVKDSFKVFDASGIRIGNGRVQKRAGRWFWIEDGEETPITDELKAGDLSFRIGKPVFDWMDTWEPRPVVVGESTVPYTAESAAIGAAVYKEFGCAGCHGEQGRGDGPAAADTTGSLGQTLRPTDYSRGPRYLKGGADAPALVRAFMTGLPGTSMPAFASNFAGTKSAPPDKAPWHLAHFIMRQAGIPFAR